MAYNEVFREELLQIFESAQGIEHASTDGHGGSQRELHSFNETGNQYAAQQFGIHAEGFQLRPKATTSHGAVGTCDYSDMRIVKFTCHVLEKTRGDAHVAVAHDQQFVACLWDQSFQATRFGIGYCDSPPTIN